MFKEKFDNIIISDFIMGIVFIIISFIVFFGRDNLYIDVVNVVVLILLLISVFQLFRYIFQTMSRQDSSKSFLSCLFNLVVCLIFVLLPNLSLGLLPLLFSLYLFILGCAQFIMYFLFLGNNEKSRKSNFIWGVIYYSISIPIILSPVGRISNFLLWLSIYTFLLGVNFIGIFLENFIDRNAKNRLRRKVRITLPKIFEAVIPYSVMKKINNILKEEGSFDKYDVGDKSKADFFILIHTSSRGVNMFGHIDIYFEGKVISYGNYDEGSRKYREMFGDGVLFSTGRRRNYINFCIDNSKKTLFEFGVKLNERQKKKIRNRIEEILQDTIVWNYKSDKKYNDGSSYAAKLYKRTRAKFYKFKSGKYKTYFVLGSNCCYLADDIIANSGVDLLSLNGIITPGTYYDYLNRLLAKKNSFVVSKSIYNDSRRCK